MAAVLTAGAGALIAGAFATHLASRYRARRRSHTLAWALALALYAVGMTALAVGLGVGWNAGWFALYWLTGALLNVVLLALGQVLLLAPAQARWWWTVGLGTVAVVVVAVGSAPVDPAALADAAARGGIPLGELAYGGTSAWAVLRPVTLTSSLIILLGAVWSGVRSRRPGVLLIAVGVAVSATSSVFLRADLDGLVAVALTAGVALMYAGFAAALRPARQR